jgi:1-acyl-sn-glycerol-3-phosphate acyltransferase
MANWGGERFLENLKRLRRTEFKIAVGRPFRINTHGERVGTVVRQRIADEMMYQVAALLPEKYRGVYCDLDRATQYYLDFN